MIANWHLYIICVLSFIVVMLFAMLVRKQKDGTDEEDNAGQLIIDLYKEGMIDIYLELKENPVSLINKNKVTLTVITHRN